MKKQVCVMGISKNDDTPFRVMMLKEIDGERTLPLIIGQAEAQAIIVALEPLSLPRPLVYDTFILVAKTFDVELQEVFI